MKRILILIVSLFLFNCINNNYDKDVAAIKGVMDKQAECWSKGDIEGYMHGYWESDSLRFLGRQGLTKGWKTTLGNYKKSYPTSSAMGTLRFTHISFEPLGKYKMLVVGKWMVYREKDTLDGYYTLVWSKIKGEWKVIFDHTN